MTSAIDPLCLPGKVVVHYAVAGSCVEKEPALIVAADNDGSPGSWPRHRRTERCGPLVERPRFPPSTWRRLINWGGAFFARRKPMPDRLVSVSITYRTYK